MSKLLPKTPNFGAYIIVGRVLVGAAVPAMAGTVNPALPVAETEIRLAVSPNGREFVDTGRLFARHAAAPDIVMLRDGGLLALYDYVDKATGQVRMVVSASPSDGKRWTAPRPIVVLDEHGEPLAAQRGAWFRARAGTLGLVFVLPIATRTAVERDEAERPVVIRHALTKNGLTYRVLPRSKPIARGRGHLHTMAFTATGRTHFYVVKAASPEDSSSRQSALAEHFVSDDGLNFEKIGVARFPGAVGSGSFVSQEDRLIAFVSGDEGIVGMRTTDEHHWQNDRQVRLANGWDPAVVRLHDGTFLMLYCAAIPDSTEDAAQMVAPILAAAPFDEGWQVGMPMPDAPAGPALAEPVSEDPAGESKGPFTTLDSAENEDSAAALDREPDAEHSGQASSMREDTTIVLPEAPPEDWDYRDGYGFVEEPDFKTRVDYLTWYGDLALGQPDENAYEAYAWFMPTPWVTPWGPPPSGAPWPELHNMFSDRSFDRPPGPWDPSQRPEWEASRNASQYILAQFRDATRYGDYAMPPLFKDTKDVEGPPVEEPLLFRMILPQLGFHRQLSRAALANAWREDRNGHVSTDKMLDAMETVLRGANHLDEGLTLIEDLVAAAERRLVHRNARWALRRGILKGADLDRALDKLERFDRNDDDPVRYLRGEHAAVMDAVQYIYGPPERNRGPRLNRDRLDHVLAGVDPTFRPDRLNDLTDEDAAATVKALTAYYTELADMMRIGYPTYRRAEFSAVAERYLHTTPLTSVLLADLGRVHQIRAHSEASRRATQLAILLHRWAERRGRFPASLAELGLPRDEPMQIDPFTGEPFLFHIEQDGFMLYSAGENGFDDGGSKHRSDGDTNIDDSDDIVFWPPPSEG